MNEILPAVPLDQYVRDTFHDGPPTLSASTAHRLLSRSPKHAWLASARLNPDHESDASEASDVGSIAHAIFLENDRSRIVVIDAPDWRTKVAKEQRDQARALGKLPVLAEKMAEIDQMVDAAHLALAAIPELRGIRDNALIEHTLLWEESGVAVRSRPDLIAWDGAVVLDLKTTGMIAEPGAWGNGLLLSMGYDIQGALALRGVRRLMKSRPECVFMVQETDAPYAVSFVGLSHAYEAFANQKLDHALKLWRDCLARDEWPAYPTRVCWAEPPSWATYRWEERLALVYIGGSEKTGKTWTALDAAARLANGEGSVDEL